MAGFSEVLSPEETILQTGINFIHAGDYKSAREKCLQVLNMEIGKEFCNIFNNLSLLYLHLDDPYKALECAQTALVIDPSSDRASIRSDAAATAIESMPSYICDKNKTRKIRIFNFLASSPGLTNARCKAGESSSSFDLAQVIANKDKGIKFYEQKKYKESLDAFENALKAGEEIMLGALSNLAITTFQTAKSDVALMKVFLETTAALAINAGVSETHYIRAQSLVGLKRYDTALEAIVIGRKYGNSKTDPEYFAEIIRDVANIRANRVIAESVSDDPLVENSLSSLIRSNRQKTFEGDIIRPKAGETHDGNSLSIMRQQMERASIDDRDMKEKLFDQRIPEFHLEYGRENLWPVSCDVAACMNHLLLTYQGSTVAVRMIEEQLLEPNAFAKTNIKDIGRRFGTRSDVRFWDTHPPYGTLKSILGCDEKYADNIHHSFPNAPKVPIGTMGKLHVSIGSVDLHELLLYAPQLQTALSRGETISCKWVGFEASPIAVAKMTVILQMVCNAAQPASIFQVWYSATWSRQTNLEFNGAISRLLLVGVGLNELTVEILRAWEKSSITIAQARKKWLESHFRPFSEVSNMKRHVDRMATITYLLTGALPPNVEEHVASPVMFGFPKHFGAMSLNETFLECINTEDLVEAADKGDIINCLCDIFQRRIQSLCQLIRSNPPVISVDIRLKAVDKDDKATQAQIKALKPDTISWSNVSDYMLASDFHQVAHAVSCPETRHYIYPSNWIIHVYGAFLFDYHTSPERTKILAEARMDLCKEMEKFGLDRYFLTPPSNNPGNLADHFLGKKFATKWLEAFMKISKVKTKVIKMEFMPFLVMYRGVSHLAITYEYMS